jgi:hypothetical protein
MEKALEDFVLASAKKLAAATGYTLSTGFFI